MKPNHAVIGAAQRKGLRDGGAVVRTRGTTRSEKAGERFGGKSRHRFDHSHIQPMAATILGPSSQRGSNAESSVKAADGVGHRRSRDARPLGVEQLRKES